MAYRVAITTLCDAIKAAFPTRMNTSRISECKQKDGKAVIEYYARLLEVFNTHSGLTQPQTLGAEAEVWECHLRNSFLQGLCEDIRAQTRLTCIGVDDARLAEVKRHATHAEGYLKTKRQKA